MPEDPFPPSKPTPRAPMEFAPDAVFVHDVWGRFVDVNRRACSTLGYSREQLLSMTVLDIEQEHQLTLSREHWQAMEPGEIETVEGVHRHADGRLIPVVVRLSAFFEDDQKMICALARPMADDASAALALATSRATELLLFREVFEHSSEGIAIIDHEGRYMRQNPAHRALLGYEDRDLVDRTPAIHLGPTAFQEIVRELAETGRYRGEHTSRTKFGAEVRIELSAFSVPGHDGQPPLFVGIKRDLGEAKRLQHERITRDRSVLEESLRQAQKMELIGQLAAGIAHDFNNLLTPIMGHAEVELLSSTGDAASASAFEHILQSAERGQELTRQLLAFGRKQVLTMRVVDLGKQAIRAQKVMRRLIPASIDIEIDVADGPHLVLADATQMQQVLMNLVTNARDAMPDGGSMRLELCTVAVGEEMPMARLLGAPGSYVRLSVSDTGCGMDESTVQHVFEPFFTQKDDGTGLGLSIVHGIVRQHDGMVQVHSEIGRGSTFEVYLPPAAKREVVDVEVNNRLAPARGETVLVVEDEEQVRSLVVQVLKRQGYQILEAADGEAAIAVADAHDGTIELLLTDVVMPGMNGNVVYERLAGERPDLRVLFMSGYARDGLTRDGQLDPGISMIEKPFSASALTWRVREALGSSANAG